MAKAGSTIAVDDTTVADAKFIIVELAPSGVKPVYDGDGQLLKFTSGPKAAEEAERLTCSTGRKHQPRPVANNDWRKREQDRMRAKDYMPLPWVKERWWQDLSSVWRDHYPHAAINKGAFIAYTESEEKGAADIQTRIKPGRYLERYFGDVLNSNVIRDLCTQFSAKYEDNQLMFAETEDEIEEVYLNGPSSCMSKGHNSYQSPIHPVRVYAAGDLQVAYMMRQGKISARAVVWPAKKTHTVIYGDAGRLRDLLRAEKYTEKAPWGARLKKVTTKKTREGLYSFVTPHLDGIGWLRDGGDCLIVGDSPNQTEESIQAGGAVGITEAVGYKCSCCGKDSMPQRAIKSVFIDDRHTRDWCSRCVKDHAFMCSQSGYLVAKDQAFEMSGVEKRGHRYMWKKYLNHAGFKCEATGEYYWSDQIVSLSDGTKWSLAYFNKHGYTCKCGTPLRDPAQCKGEDKCPVMKARQEADKMMKINHYTVTGASAYITLDGSSPFTIVSPTRFR